MADTITIGGSTYHKLVTFRDCAAKTDLYGKEISGTQDLLPWAFVEYYSDVDKRENGLQTFAPRYFVQKLTKECISYDMLKNTPAGCTNDNLYKTEKTLGQKKYYKLICKKDIKYNNELTSFDYGISNSRDGGNIGWDKHIRTYFGEGNDPNSNHMYSANALTQRKGVDETWSEGWSVDFHPPHNKHSYFKYGVYKTGGSSAGKFAIAVRVTSGVAYEEVKKHIIRWPGQISSAGGDPYYRGVNIYNNDGTTIGGYGVNYALFWNICRTAILNGKKIGLYMSVNH